MSTPEQRRRFRQYHEECRRIAAGWEARGNQYPPPRYPPIPPELAALACGAKTRKGTPCKLTSTYLSGRCKFHGGLSTGPKTPEGKAKCAANGRCPKRKKTKSMAHWERSCNLRTYKPTLRRDRLNCTFSFS